MVLDLLLEREPHARPAARLSALVERQQFTGLLGATTITTVHYLSRKALGEVGARRQIEALLRLFELASVTRAVLEGALQLRFRDFEDAVLHESALHAGADGIVTRDPGGFRSGVLRVYEPAELLAVLDSL